MSWTPPSEFEEYRIVRSLGAGAMGTVFLAHDTLLDRAVAIKFIRALEVGAAARERFFTEARAIARLSHPNVVGIHRIGELRQRPYLVSEYVRGASLDTIAKPLAWERALKIGIGLARGLASAHRRNVLHRDIKPANVILGEDDEPKLLDFGLAKLVETHGVPHAGRPVRVRPDAALDATTSVPGRPAAPPHAAASQLALTAEGALVGTPLYLAPELWRGEPGSRRTDVYALGVVLYELLAGRTPHAGLDADELAARVLADDPAPIAAVAHDVPARFASVIDACVSRDPARRPDSGDALREVLEAVVPRATPLVDGSPYRGLSAFEPEHRALFFGRMEEARAVVERLRTETVVVVAGDSGAGKSSLCRAAVLPAIAEKALAGKRWTVVTMLPGAHPRAELDAALAKRRGDDGMLLFVDQLEELLTLADPTEAAEVAERLAELAVASSHTRVLASARSDFLGRLAALPGFGELIGRALYLLGPLGERGLREAIVGPARALGYELAPETVDELAASGRHLPLLQFTLAELWDARDDRTRTIPADALARIGGVAGALARRADQVMAALGDVDRELAWRVLVRLMTAEGTRAVVTRAELGETTGDRDGVERVVERLVSARLLVVSAGSDDRVEVVHEALFTGWPRLVEWRRAHEDGARMRDLHGEAARRWHERGRPRGLLWRGDALDDYRAWRRRWPERPTGTEAAFAEACEADERRSRRRRIVALALVLVALSTGLVVLYRFERRATHERDVAERQRRSLYVEQGLQELTKGNSARALPYFVQARREGENTPAVQFLIAEAMRPLEQRLAINHDIKAGIAAIAWAPHGTWYAAVGNAGAAAIYDGSSGKLLHALHVPSEKLNVVAFSPDGMLLVAGGRGNDVYIWDAVTGRLAHTLTGHTADIASVVFAASGDKFATISVDGMLREWNPRTGELLKVVADKPVTCAAYSTAGDRVVLGMEHGEIRGYEAASWQPLFASPAAPLHPTCRCTLSPDGGRLLVAGIDNVQLIDARTGKLLAQLLQHRAPIAFSPDSKLAATGGPDGVVRLWDARTGSLVRSLVGHTSSVGELHFSSDGKRLVSTGLDRTFRIFDVDRGLLEITFEASVTSPSIGTAMALDAQFSSDGTKILTATGNELRLERASRGALLHEIPGEDSACVAWSPDGTSLAICDLRDIEIWDVARNERTTLIEEVGDGLWDLGWSKDGELLVTGKHGLAELRSVADGSRRPLVGHDPAESVNRGAFSPDNARIVTASGDHTARIWDTRSARELRVLRHPDSVMAATWSADGARIATSCWDGGLRVWDAATGNRLVELRDPQLRFLDVTFSPDGKHLAATSHSGVVTIWNLAKRERTQSLIGHNGPTTTAAWSPDGALIASTSSDGTARIWDAAGRQLASRPHADEALQALWDRDGTRIAVPSRKGGVRIWEVTRDRHELAELDEILATRVPWKLVDGRLEVVELMK